MAKFTYEIFDEVEQKKLEGTYTSSEVQKITGKKTSAAWCAQNGYLVDGRYRVRIATIDSDASDYKESDTAWAREWDAARLRLLALKKS